MLNTATFFGCDWGSTAFRLRLVEAPSRRVLGELSAPAGVKTFTGFPAAERSERMGRYLAGRPILITGMASSNVGWKELPYAMAPFPLDGSSARAEGVEFTDTAGRRRRALLCSGARTADDVMRGEE
ncbi:MAG: 2-dehydro-3-deoxygalactonokinase, partial [Undibacterium sp.]|nr:2-dehydro-3-deoxygalactonokinase [Opitutaceae bacterium]